MQYFQNRKSQTRNLLSLLLGFILSFAGMVDARASKIIETTVMY